ncbi:MAG: TonB-dependent receptor [Pseudomonadota bacterium]
MAEEEPTIIEEMIVTAHPLSGDLAQPTLKLEGDELNRNLTGTLGDTLIHQPGINSSTFGPAVGRPVIRGLGGPRVRVMEDRIGTQDVSVSSADHATTIEPFAANHVEVLKGPSTLLFGTGAIGGVVDVHTGRVPHLMPEDGVDVKAEIRGADNADQRTAFGRIDAGSDGLVIHLDGSYRDADEYEIPGFAESEALRELEEEGGEGEEEEEAFGILPGSEMETKSGAFGLSYIGDRGFVGAAISRYESVYGLPGGHEHEHEGEDGEEEGEEEEEGNPILDLEQTRFDVEAALLDPFAGAESLNIRLGYVDYEHTEFEPDGGSGTTFANEALEARIELVHEAVGGVRGAGGFQYIDREFSALGDEAFVDPVDTTTFGFFYVGQKEFDALNLDFGVRYERVSHDPTGNVNLPGSTVNRNFDVGAVSLGLLAPFADVWSFGLQLDYSTRAPTAEELFSYGPHLATRTFEIGDPTLSKERAANIGGSLRFDYPAFAGGINLYYTDFTDFIYEVPNGEEMDDLPVVLWQQDDAEVTGAEIDLEWRIVRDNEWNLSLTGFYDLARAKLKDGDNRNLPRIPPQRVGVGGIFGWRGLTVTLDYVYTDEQDKVAEFELPTDSFEDLRAYIGYGFQVGDGLIEVFLAGRNLTDDEQRYHASFIKDFAPQPGRTIEGGVRVTL